MYLYMLILVDTPRKLLTYRESHWSVKCIHVNIKFDLINLFVNFKHLTYNMSYTRNRTEIVRPHCFLEPYLELAGEGCKAK